MTFLRLEGPGIGRTLQCSMEQSCLVCAEELNLPTYDVYKGVVVGVALIFFAADVGVINVHSTNLFNFTLTTSYLLRM